MPSWVGLAIYFSVNGKLGVISPEISTILEVGVLETEMLHSHQR